MIGERLGIVEMLQLDTCGLYLCGSAKDAGAISTDAYADAVGGAATLLLGDTEPSHCLDKAEFPLRALQERRIRDQRAHLLFQKRLFLRAGRCSGAGNTAAAVAQGHRPPHRAHRAAKVAPLPMESPRSA